MSAQRETRTEGTHHVVVLGAGYAGMAAAVQLAARTAERRDTVRVTVVNAGERFTERMRLHMTAAGRLLDTMSVPEMLAGTGARFTRGWVTAVDAGARTVRVDDERVLSYDTLVYALGGVADTSQVPGADDYAYTLSSTEDARLLADRLKALGGEGGATDREDGERGERGDGTVVVVGTGLTGVESAAEIAERYPRLDVVLLGGEEPGAAMNDKARAHVRAALGRLGVRVRGGVRVAKVLAGSVELEGGESIAADAVLWTGGTRVAPLAAAAGLEV
ncbi:NAD(P)/FAD-dependent oxidoreductase, partial [Streptomyces rubiginosohelvolus]